MHAAQIVGRVAGVLKMTGKDEAQKNKPLRGETGTGAKVTATLEFAPPVHVRWARFDAAGRTTFISAFYASPAGVRTLMGVFMKCSYMRGPGGCLALFHAVFCASA